MRRKITGQKKSKAPDGTLLFFMRYFSVAKPR
ncbi:MAG: hypothetical protein ACI89E_001832, partial [Planctomycetota bacterium]